MTGHFHLGVVHLRGMYWYHVLICRSAARNVNIVVLLVEVAAMVRTNWLWIVTIGFLGSGALRGEGFPSAANGLLPTDERVAAWIEQLDRSIYGERQAASQLLEAAGAAALAHLEATVASGSREASGRSLDILKRHFQHGADDVKLAAREALGRLAQHENASTAQRARDVLNPPQTAATTTPVRFQPAPLPGINAAGIKAPGINFFAGPVLVNPAGLRKVSISDINGRRVVEIDDRERRVVMDTARNGGIEIEVADKQNRRNPTRKLAAKDLDDLKQKDPELGRLYEQHGTAQLLPAAVPPFGIRPQVRTIR